MRVLCITRLMIAVLFVCARRASAFLEPPYITPKHSTSADVISVNIYGGECDLVDMGIFQPPVTHQGNKITILFTGIHEGDPEFCYYDTGTSIFPIGTFSPGEYTLDVEWRYMSSSGPWVQETLGIVPFSVSMTPSQKSIKIPTLGIAALCALFVGLIATSLHNLRKSRA